MTIENKETIQRALGQIEGVALLVKDNVQGALLDAVQMIDGVLEKEEVTE